MAKSRVAFESDRKFPLVALEDFPHEGIRYVKGQEFETTAIHAAALTHQRKARFLNRSLSASAHSVGPDTPPTTPTQDERQAVAEGRRTRGRPRKDSTYDRRDLTAKAPDAPSEG